MISSSNFESCALVVLLSQLGVQSKHCFYLKGISFINLFEIHLEEIFTLPIPIVVSKSCSHEDFLSFPQHTTWSNHLTYSPKFCFSFGRSAYNYIYPNAKFQTVPFLYPINQMEIDL
jgi:hypothetical protein